jgi:hypothetical protein
MKREEESVYIIVDLREVLHLNFTRERIMHSFTFVLVDLNDIVILVQEVFRFVFFD